MFRRLQRYAVPLEDTLDSVIARVLDKLDEGHPCDKPIQPDRDEPEHGDQLPAKALPEKEFRDPLIEAMYELGGRANSRKATDLVGEKMAPLLGHADREMRSDGKQKWENNVHWSRLKLVKEGLFKKGSGRDVWELTESGIKYAEDLITKRNLGSGQARENESAVRNFDPRSVPNLRHTKLLSAKVGNEIIPPTWNGLLFEVIRRIPKERLAKPEEARRFIITNFVSGKKVDEGYRFVPELGISVQGQDANDAWRAASHIAQKLGIPVEVEFLWRMKEGAAFPGSMGRIAV